MGEWIVRATQNPDEKPAGLIKTLPTGLVRIEIDGEFTADAATRIRIQLAAAINDVSNPS